MAKNKRGSTKPVPPGEVTTLPDLAPEPRAPQETVITGFSPTPLPIAPPALLIDPKTAPLPLVMPVTIKLAGPVTIKSTAAIALTFQGWTIAVTNPSTPAVPITLLLNQVVGWKANVDDPSKTNIMLTTTELITVQGDFQTISKQITDALNVVSTYSQ